MEEATYISFCLSPKQQQQKQTFLFREKKNSVVTVRRRRRERVVGKGKGKGKGKGMRVASILFFKAKTRTLSGHAYTSPLPHFFSFLFLHKIRYIQINFLCQTIFVYIVIN